MLDTKIWYM